MVMLRIIGVCMALLLLLLFAVLEAGRKRAACRSDRNLLVSLSCLGPHGHIIFALQKGQNTHICSFGMVPAMTYFSMFLVNIGGGIK